MKQLLALLTSQMGIGITKNETDGCHASVFAQTRNSIVIPEKKLLFPEPFRPTIHVRTCMCGERTGPTDNIVPFAEGVDSRLVFVGLEALDGNLRRGSATVRGGAMSPACVAGGGAEYLLDVHGDAESKRR